MPVGTGTYVSRGSVVCWFSQYRRVDDVIVPVTQYTVTLVSNWSRVKAFSGSPSQSLQARNFSTIHDNKPAGESFSPMPRVCGLVPCNMAYADSSRPNEAIAARSAWSASVNSTSSFG